MSGTDSTHHPPHGGVYEHVAAEEAKARHAHDRPQQHDAPDLTRLAPGTAVSYTTHSHAGVGVVGRELATMAERLGPSLHTHEGRGPFKDEMCYEVVDNASGTTHVMRRGELHVVGQGGDNARLSEAQRQAEQFADTSGRVVAEGHVMAHETARKPPHRK